VIPNTPYILYSSYTQNTKCVRKCKIVKLQSQNCMLYIYNILNYWICLWMIFPTQIIQKRK